MAAIFIALVILTPVTWARNAQWASDLFLYESDYRKGKQEGRILHFLVGAHLGAKNYSRTTEICDRHASRHKRMGKFNYRCGLAYGQTGRMDDAEQAFILAMKDHRLEASAHADRARLLAAKTHLEQALQLQPQHIPARKLLEQLNQFLDND